MSSSRCQELDNSNIRRWERTENNLARGCFWDCLCEEFFEVFPCAFTCTKIGLDVDVNGEALLKGPAKSLDTLRGIARVHRRKNNARPRCA